jgi:hypothetical protein
LFPVLINQLSFYSLIIVFIGIRESSICLDLKESCKEKFKTAETLDAQACLFPRTAVGPGLLCWFNKYVGEKKTKVVITILHRVREWRNPAGTKVLVAISFFHCHNLFLRCFVSVCWSPYNDR